MKNYPWAVSLISFTFTLEKSRKTGSSFVWEGYAYLFWHSSNEIQWVDCLLFVWNIQEVILTPFQRPLKRGFKKYLLWILRACGFPRDTGAYSDFTTCDILIACILWSEVITWRQQWKTPVAKDSGTSTGCVTLRKPPEHTMGNNLWPNTPQQIISFTKIKF